MYYKNLDSRKKAGGEAKKGESPGKLRNSGEDRKKPGRGNGTGFLLAVLFLAAGIFFLLGRGPGLLPGGGPGQEGAPSGAAEAASGQDALPGGIPFYSGEDYIILNGNQPSFTGEELARAEGARFSGLDELGRCGVASALLHRSLMPEAERGEIGMVKPSGWHTVKYPDLIEDRYLYNRCHLIAYRLCGENDNPENLITGTRHLNTEGMLPFEVKVMNYLEHSDNRVAYRVTPHFLGDELVARGVEMEALSVEDGGRGICFHIFVYNIQPGIEIDYATGDSRRAE